jgi:phosphoribosylformylglycinamidine synthase
MAGVNVLLLRAPGTNCERETAHAWEQAGARTRHMHINALIHQPRALDDAQILTVSGGFCYGDDVSAGKIMATEMRLFLTDALRRFVDAGRLILGVCNGFQVLVKTGLLPGPPLGDNSVTLAFNTSGRYEDRWVHIKPATAHCRFIDGDVLLYMPVAHAEGRIVLRDDAVLSELSREDRIAFIYTDENGAPGRYPTNPNGSMGSIAGLTDGTGQVLGLMPHPERNAHLTNHPLWTSLPRDRMPDGLRLFQTAVAAMR